MLVQEKKYIVLPTQQQILRCPIIVHPPVAEATLKFTYVEKYPDEPPEWEIFSRENLEDADEEEILTLLQQQVCAVLGLHLTFPLLVQVIRPWLEYMNDILYMYHMTPLKVREERHTAPSSPHVVHTSHIFIDSCQLYL